MTIASEREAEMRSARSDAGRPEQRQDRPSQSVIRPEPGATSDARHRDVAEVASDWIWETDADRRLTFVSKRFGDTSGIPWSHVNGRSLGDLVAMGFDRAGMDEIHATIEARAIFHGIAYRIDIVGGGTRFWRMSGKPFFDPATGAFAGYRGTGTDVTAEMEREAAMDAARMRAEAAEQEARQARQRLVDAIEAIPEGFVLHDADDHLVLCNTRYREIHGLSTELIAHGTRFEDILRDANRRGIYVSEGRDAEEWITERLRRHQALEGKYIEQQLANGRWLQVEERRTSDGGTVGILVDVTEARRREALEHERERTIAELQAARLVQTSLLPSARLQKEIIAKSGLDIASRSASCTELGGDLWGLSDLDQGRVGVYALDVAGHGTTAALNTFRLHTLIHELGAWLLDPTRFLKELNMRLTDLLQPGTFATMFYGIIDPGANCITYAAAGSPPPLIRSASGLRLRSLDSTGVPLGITVSADYASFKADFYPGGTLFLYSDILSDFTDERGHRAGEEGAFAMIQDCAEEPTAEAAVARICAPFLFPPGRPLSDDLTVVCIMRPEDRPVVPPVTDPITGTLDRHAGETRLRESFKLWLRQRHRFSVLMIDIGYASSGDEPQDEILIALARTVQQKLRGADAIFRWNSRTFLVLLPGSRQAAAERLRAELEAAELVDGDGARQVPLRIGIAEVREADSGFDGILHRADRSMQGARPIGG